MTRQLRLCGRSTKTPNNSFLSSYKSFSKALTLAQTNRPPESRSCYLNITRTADSARRENQMLAAVFRSLVSKSFIGFELLPCCRYNQISGSRNVSVCWRAAASSEAGDRDCVLLRAGMCRGVSVWSRAQCATVLSRPVSDVSWSVSDCSSQRGHSYCL